MTTDDLDDNAIDGNGFLERTKVKKKRRRKG